MRQEEQLSNDDVGNLIIDPVPSTMIRSFIRRE